MNVYEWAAAAVAAVPALFLADRFLLLLERHGWIYWRKREPEVGASGMLSVINEIQTLLSPGQRHVAEEQLRQSMVRDDESSGAPPLRRIDLDSGHTVIRIPRTATTDKPGGSH